MSALKTRLLAQGLLQKGFIEVESHHRRFFLHVFGKRTSVHTKISHGDKELGDTLAALVARQLSLNRKELDDLVNCPLDHAGYVDLLKRRDRLPPGVIICIARVCNLAFPYTLLSQ